ncbi:MAG: nucleotidyltransferase family protein [Candidatus Aminicenantes bacterium]|nr:nucleotidyltransferase family protein [Candidatus Aminicenantes bacterium]
MESQRSGRAPIAAGDRFLDLLRSEAPEIKKRFGVRKIGLFGSAVRGEARPDSDLDILVEFETPTFDRYMDLKFHLESLFGRPCDLVLIDTLKQGVRSRALSEAIYA